MPAGIEAVGESTGSYRSPCARRARARGRSGLTRHEFQRRVAPAFRPEPAHVLARSGRRVLLGVAPLDRVADAFAAHRHGTDANRAFAHLHRAERIVEERAIPAAGLLHPRPREHAAADDDRPDADEAMIGARAGADCENPALVDRGDDLLRKSAWHAARDGITRDGTDYADSASNARIHSPVADCRTVL